MRNSFKSEYQCISVSTPDCDIEDVQDVVEALRFILDGRSDNESGEVLDEALHRFGFWSWYKKI